MPPGVKPEAGLEELENLIATSQPWFGYGTSLRPRACEGASSTHRDRRGGGAGVRDRDRDRDREGGRNGKGNRNGNRTGNGNGNRNGSDSGNRNGKKVTGTVTEKLTVTVTVKRTVTVTVTVSVLLTVMVMVTVPAIIRHDNDDRSSRAAAARKIQKQKWHLLGAPLRQPRAAHPLLYTVLPTG